MTHSLKNSHMGRVQLVVCTLVVSVLFASPVIAQDLDAPAQGWLDGTPRAALIGHLSHFHGAPTLEELSAIDIELQKGLIDVALDESLAELPRKRAVTLLANFPNEETLATADTLIAADTELSVLGRTAILVGALGETHPEWAIGQLEVLSRHDDFIVREMTVNSMAKIRTVPVIATRVDDALLQLVIAERNPAVKTALKDAMMDVPVLTPSNGRRVQPIQVK